MTGAEFDVWVRSGADGSRRYQLIDGAVHAMAPASTTHGSIQANLCAMLVRHLDAPGARCRVVTAPAIAIRIRARDNRRVPDLGVTCAPDRAGDVVLPDPILLIEILSPGNAKDTWDNVRGYASIPSVLDILVVNSLKVEAELWSRQTDGTWPAEPALIAVGDTLRLSSIECEASLESAYAKTHLANS